MATTRKTTAPKSKASGRSSASSANKKTGTAKKKTAASKSPARKAGSSSAKGGTSTKRTSAVKSTGAKTASATAKTSASKKTSTGSRASSSKKTTAASKASTAKRTSGTAKTSTAKKATASAKKNTSPKSKSIGAAPSRPKRAAARATTPARSTATAKNKRTVTATTKRKVPAKKQGTVAGIINSVTSLFSSGPSNAIDLLKKDHDAVDDLFERVRANEDGNNQDLFVRIKAELDVHAHIEEQIFYPHLLQNGDKELQKLVREGLEEHLNVKTMLGELAELSGTDPQFKAKLQVLMENVEHHVEEEESDMFPMVEDQVDDDTLVRLGNLMEAEKARVKGGSSRSAASR